MPVLPNAPAPGQLLSVTVLPGDAPGRAVVEVIGEVDDSTAPLLQLCLDSRTDQPDLRELVVDLEQVTVLGADGVAALSRAHRRCARRGVRVLLRCGGRRRLLDRGQLTRLTERVEGLSRAAASTATPALRGPRGPRRRRRRAPSRRAPG